LTDRVREHLSHLIQHDVDEGSRQAGGLVDTGERACADRHRGLPDHGHGVAACLAVVVAVDQPDRKGGRGCGGGGPALLFARIERKKTWLMVKKDLERVGIAYETPAGIADFHAGGRHSHITGLIRSGASIMEANELARHADIRQTAKYTQIGMEDRAEALANLLDSLISTCVDNMRIVCISGGAGRQQASRDDSGDDGGGGGNEQTPVVPGFASPRVTNCHQLKACGKMEAAGIAPAALAT
jgi:hypothetical protein